MGFIFADGYVSKPEGKKFARFGISLQDGDSGHLEKLRVALESDVPIHHYEVSQGYKVGSKYCRIVISDDKLANDLIKHGCVEHKSNILKPPTNLPYELRKHFIRGYMDGNGSITMNNSRYGKSFTIKWVGTDDMLMWIMEHLISDGIITRRYHLYKRKKEQIVSTFEFGGNDLSKRYLDYIYKDATVFLDRKYERYIVLTNIIKERECNKKKEPCCICGQLKRDNIKYNKQGEYFDKYVCKKHYRHLLKFGYPIPEKKDKCDICGDKYGRMIQVGQKYPEYHGMTFCRRHYEQISTKGTITNLEMGWHKDE